MTPRIKHDFDVYLEEQGGRTAEAIIRPVPRSLYSAARWLHERTMVPTLYLHRLWVAKEKRKLSFGSLLMKQVVAIADGMQVDLILRVEPFEKAMSEAQLAAFYAGFGFKATTVRGVLLRRFNRRIVL